MVLHEPGILGRLSTYGISRLYKVYQDITSSSIRVSVMCHQSIRKKTQQDDVLKREVDNVRMSTKLAILEELNFRGKVRGEKETVL